MGIVVRRAERKDAKVLSKIIVESWAAAYGSLLPKEELEKYLDEEKRRQQFVRFLDQEELIFLGFVHGEPFGLIFGGLEHEEGDPRLTSIYSLYLRKEFWGQGLGKPLLEAMVTSLQEKGAKDVRLWVFEENKRARAFYEKHGFVLTGEVKKSRFSNGAMEVSYGKTLI